MAAPGRGNGISSSIYPDFSKKYPVGGKYFFKWLNYKVVRWSGFNGVEAGKRGSGEAGKRGKGSFLIKNRVNYF
jgi:hypothetical protein